MGKKAFPYVVTCIGIYVSLSLIELFGLKVVLDMVSTSFFFHLWVNLALIVVVNPIVTRLITDKIDFNIKNEEGSV